MDPHRDGAAGENPTEEEQACWPAGSRHPDEEVVSASCTSCGLSWRVHRDLVGYRLQCRCGTWVDVPEPPNQATLPRAVTPENPPVARRTHVVLATSREIAAQPAPHAGQIPDGELRHASVRVQARWANRTILELCLVMTAFWVPALAVQLGTTGSRRALLMPLTAVVASLLIILIGFTSRQHTFAGLTRPRPRHVIESLAACAGFLLAAVAWIAILKLALPELEQDELSALRDRVGLPLSLFVVAFCPGVFEELAFRGLIQGRVSQLLGVTQGALVTGAIFGLAHGITLGLPLHMGLGVYLCFLRLRSKSLLPGMLLHMLYNGTLVVINLA